jgi:hypothetical protein
MSASNTDLSRFAVFINSKSAVYPSLTKSDVIIPFAANLADHDPMKVMKISITDVLFSNVFYNVRPGVQTLKFCDTFAAGRNKSAGFNVEERQIEFGFYSYDSFSDWADSNMGLYVNRSITGSYTGTQPVFYGFGSKYAGLSTSDTPASLYSLQTAKVWFQSPTLGDLFQPFKKDSTVSIGGSQSGIYSGKYLVVDDSTYGLMHLLGFSHRDIAEAPIIPGTDLRGLGYPIYSRQTGNNTEYSFDQITWGSSTADTTMKELVPITISDFTGLDDLYIHCEQFRTQFLSGVSKAPLQPNDVVCVVPINVAYAEKMSFVPNFPLESFLQNTNVTQLRFRMTNSNNEELDFHGINWSLTIYCEEVDDEARIQAENKPVGNLPQTFFSNGLNSDYFSMQNRATQAATKRRL